MTRFFAYPNVSLRSANLMMNLRVEFLCHGLLFYSLQNNKYLLLFILSQGNFMRFLKLLLSYFAYSCI